MIVALLILAFVLSLLAFAVSVVGDDIVAASGVRTIGIIAAVAILAATAIQITEILT